MQSNRQENSLLIKLIVLVILIWIVSTIVILLSLDNWSDRGTFGDLFGAVNALFSGLAFAGLIYTIYLQKQDLIIQRREIELNRNELKKAAKAQQHSEKALVDQVEQMKISAKLNALNTLINYYNTQISNSNNSEEIITKAKLKRRETIFEIDALIDRVSDTEFE